MISKRVYNLRDPKVLTELKKIVQEIKDTVTATMGPMGSTVILYDGDTVPHVTKDGVSVAEFLRYEDNFREAINRIIKETARMTGEKIGDGTTTSILLACDMILEIIDSDDEYEDLIDGIEKDIAMILDLIKEYTVELDIFSEDTLHILRNIALTSSNGDKEITDTIMRVVEQIGPEGLIDVIPSLGEETSVEIQDGMLIEAPAMVTRTVEVSSPYVVLVSSPIEKVHEIKTFMKLANQVWIGERASVILIADRFSEEIQNVVTVNNRNNKLKVYLAESDGFGFTSYEIYDDMALLLDSKIMSLDSSSPFGLQNITAAQLMTVDKAILSPQQTVLYDHKFSRDEVQQQKAELLDAIAVLKDSGSDKIGELRQLQKRLTKYAKSATIRIGGATEAERLEKTDRAEDAVLAIHSSVNNGVVPGGGFILYQAYKKTKSSIIGKVAQGPLLTMVPGEKDRLQTVLTYDEGMSKDFITGKNGHFLDVGVIDPAQVLVKAIQQALTVTKMIMGSKAIVVPIKQAYGEA